jgi:EAL domain-containing protein (putative c-di-GMP-specific phosphodiesterase class I)
MQQSEELDKRELSIEHPNKLLTVLNNLKQYRYDPKRIVAEFSKIKSLEQREKALQNNCEILEKRISEDRQVLRLLQRIRSMGISIDKLLPFSMAVNEKSTEI